MSILQLVLLGLTESDPIAQMLIRGLAVAGAAAVGGLGAGLVAQILVRLVALRSVPRPILLVIRVLGGLALGWLVALWVFRTGTGSGWGSGDGFGLTGSSSPTNQHASQRDYSPSTGKGPRREEGALRIEVLDIDREHHKHYRLEGQRELLTLADVRKIVEDKQRQPPWKILTIIIYEDSPATGTGIVRDLEQLARENNLSLEVFEPRGSAP